MRLPIAVLVLAAPGAIAGTAATQELRPAGAEGVDFVAAAAAGDADAVRRALDANPRLVEVVDGIGLTALDWAATREHWRLFRYLLERGAPVSNVGFDGGTVLHRVSHFDRPEEVRALLDAGANVATRNQWGRTALHVAARRGCPQVAAVLLANGADPNVGTNEGWTPLHVAYRADQPDLIRLLLAAGADPQRRDSAGRLPAEHAFERPAAIPIDPAALDEYQGLYDMGNGAHFKVWMEGGRLRLREFAADELYPTGPDTFYCRAEPWSVVFHRNDAGAVDEIEVSFLRRTVRARKRVLPRYVGSDACAACHSDATSGGQYVAWLRGRHASAYWRLATDWARFLARQRPHYQDLDDPRRDDRCLLCHTTAAQDPDAVFDPTFRVAEGVGCEACHGAGSAYLDPRVMTDRAAFLAAGGRVPDEGTCRRCHRNAERFAFDEWWPRIAHPRPQQEGRRQ